MLALHQKLSPVFRRIKNLPVAVRLILGMLLMIGGLFGALPILGFWMIPLGLLVLSLDFRWARRGYLTIIIWLRKWRNHRHQH